MTTYFSSRQFALRGILACLIFAPVHAVGAVTWFGPSPYLSRADSPFDLSGLGSTFFLEDFEDGVFNLPPGVTTGPPEIQVPGPNTGSVDADDGAIDGNGQGGHSIKAHSHYGNFANPPTNYNAFGLRFYSETFPVLNNAFGFVWTDGVPGSKVLVSLYDVPGPNQQLIARRWFDAEVDFTHTGDTSQHRFIGVHSTVPIGHVVVEHVYVSSIQFNVFQMDHIQFGYQVPEPSSHLALLFGLGFLARSRSRFLT